MPSQTADAVGAYGRRPGRENRRPFPHFRAVGSIAVPAQSAEERQSCVLSPSDNTVFSGRRSRRQRVKKVKETEVSTVSKGESVGRVPC